MKKFVMVLMELVITLALILGGVILAVPALAAGGVGIEIAPASQEVSIGQTFTVDIVVTIPQGEAVDFATVSVDFNPDKLEVLSITGGDKLPETWYSDFDNDDGTLDYHSAAGLQGPDATADFILATVEFLAKEASASTPLTFMYLAPDRNGNRQTCAILAAQPVLDALAVLDGEVVINAETQCTLMTNVNPAQGGTVTGGGTYDCGTTVPVEAIPDDDCWYFVEWTGALSGSTNPTSILLDADKSITANFDKYDYTLTTNVSPPGGGTVTDGGSYECGTDVQITATPIDDCWEFTGWSGDYVGVDNPTTITVDDDMTVTANFAEIQYDLTATANPADGGTVTGGGTYDCGSTVTVTAIPADDCCEFTGWSGDYVGVDNTTTITVDDDMTVTANFAEIQYDLTATANPAEGGTVSGGGSYDCGDTATIEATPAYCYYFVGWSGDLSGSTNPTTILIDGDKTVTATFELDTDIMLTTIANPADGGTISGGGAYDCDDTATIQAVANTGYVFIGWSGDLTGSTNPTTIYMDTDKTITANFEESATPTPTSTPSPTPSPTPTHTPTITPTPTATFTLDKPMFRTGPTVTLRPVTDEISASSDGLVELFISNPTINDVTLNGDMTFSVPSGIHVYGQSFGLAGAAGTVYGQFSVLPGTAKTYYMNIKADETAVGKSFYIHFSGTYYPDDNKDAYNQISLTHPFTVNDASPAPLDPNLTDPNQIDSSEVSGIWIGWGIIIGVVALLGIIAIVAIISRRTEVTVEQ